MFKTAGVKGIPLLFLMTDGQIVNDRFLIYINDILANGWISDLFPKVSSRPTVSRPTVSRPTALRPTVKFTGWMQALSARCFRCDRLRFFYAANAQCCTHYVLPCLPIIYYHTRCLDAFVVKINVYVWPWYMLTHRVGSCVLCEKISG